MINLKKILRLKRHLKLRLNITLDSPHSWDELLWILTSIPAKPYHTDNIYKFGPPWLILFLTLCGLLFPLKTKRIPQLKPIEPYFPPLQRTSCLHFLFPRPSSSTVFSLHSFLSKNSFINCIVNIPKLRLENLTKIDYPHTLHVLIQSLTGPRLLFTQGTNKSQILLQQL